MKLIGSPRVRPIRSQSQALWRDEDDEDEQAPKEERKKTVREATVPLAFACRLDGETMAAGPNHEVWFQAVGPLAVVDDRVQVTPGWLAAAATRSSVAICLSSQPAALLVQASAIRAVARASGRACPLILVGPFLDDAAEELDQFAGVADGFILQARRRDDPALEAEMLRRAASCLGERLILERGSWTEVPATCLIGSPDVLAMVAPSVCDYVLLDDPPAPKAIPGGKLIVTADSEHKPWWAVAYGAVGPEVLAFRPWMMDPRSVR